MVEVGANNVFVKAIRPPADAVNSADRKRRSTGGGIQVETHIAFRYDVNLTDIEDAFQNHSSEEALST